MKINDAPLSAGLFLVSTPIGNARDITLRALDLLAGADVLVAEDTRSLRHLMQIHGLAPGQRPVWSCHDHSGPGVLAQVVAAVAEGKAVVYASEAGTPVLSDPGFTLVRAVRAAGLPVTAAPGPSALLAALAVSGIAAERFLFLGFLPAAQAARQAAIAEVVSQKFGIVLYESPHRVEDTVRDLTAGLGAARPVALCRELTKRFEEVKVTTLGELARDPHIATIRGEIVLVLGPPVVAAMDDDAVRTALRAAMVTMRIKDAATAVAGAMGLPRRDVYQMALRLGDHE
jgi:16S rRNA (cytidine1402-2'-O)-methyltransferase